MHLDDEAVGQAVGHRVQQPEVSQSLDLSRQRGDDMVRGARA